MCTSNGCFNQTLGQMRVLGQPYLVSVFPNTTSTSSPERITITAMEFGEEQLDVTNVTVGGVPCADFTVLSDKIIICQAPQNVGRNRPIVLTRRGGYQSAPLAFGYSPPVVTSVSP